MQSRRCGRPSRAWALSACIVVCAGELAAAHPAATVVSAALRLDSQQEAPGTQATLDRANEALKRGRWDEALALYKRVNASMKDKSPEALWGMAQVYSGLGADKNVGEALDKLLPLIADDPGRQAESWNLRGQSAWIAGLNKNPRKYVEAEAHFKRALELQPDLAIAHYNLGMAFFVRKADSDGIEQMKAYLAEAPNGPKAAGARMLIDNPRRARENFATEFAATTLAGERISLADLHGKVVLLDFWATWCGPCNDALPALKRFVERSASESLVVVSISNDADREKWRAFVSEKGMTWSQVHDPRGAIGRAYQVEGIPTYVVIDHEGIIRERFVGYGSGTDGSLQSAVNKCLKAAKVAAAGGR
jgi:tetratricopeptide (TPR) repeat protein